MINSEWIEKLRAAAAMCRSPDDDLDYKYWAAVAFDMLPKASAYICQQAASLAATEERVREHEAHENQTHEVLGKILGTDDTLENVARRAVDRIAELESQIIHQTGISACRIEERERMQKQIATLQEIAEEERACRLSSPDTGAIPTVEHYNALDPEGSILEARRQLSEEHPEVDWK